MAEIVPTRFHQAAQRFDERPLLFRKTSAGWQSMSYQQLERSARGLALALMERLPGQGGIAVEIRDKSGFTLPPGPPGQIFVRGAGVFAGYWKDDTLNRTVIDEFGWLATGDQGRWTQDGELQILGREDDTIVLANGEKVPAPRLENELVTDPWIQQAVVVGQGQPTMAVFFVLDPMVTQEWASAHGGSLSAETLLEHPAITAEIRTHLERLFSDRSRFASFERITLFRLLSRPLVVGRELSGTGKLRRAEFNRLYVKQIEEIYRQG